MVQPPLEDPRAMEDRILAVEQAIKQLDPKRPRFSSDDFRRASATRIYPELRPLASNGILFTVGTEAADAISVAVQFQIGDKDVSETVAAPWYLADDVAGLDPATVAPTGGTAAGTDGALIESVANLSGLLISEATGRVDVVLTDTGTPTFYFVVVLPDGRLAVSPAITFA